MSLSLILAFVWMVVANVIGMFPSHDNHWRNAYMLIGVGVPIVLFVIWQNGLGIGVLVLLMGAWVLRWPVYYLALWLKKIFGRKDAENDAE